MKTAMTRESMIDSSKLWTSSKTPQFRVQSVQSYDESNHSKHCYQGCDLSSKDFVETTPIQIATPKSWLCLKSVELKFFQSARDALAPLANALTLNASFLFANPQQSLRFPRQIRFFVRYLTGARVCTLHAFHNRSIKIIVSSVNNDSRRN